jgi:hypothetical protein
MSSVRRARMDTRRLLDMRTETLEYQLLCPSIPVDVVVLMLMLLRTYLSLQELHCKGCCTKDEMDLA